MGKGQEKGTISVPIVHFPIFNEPNELRSNTFDSRKPGRLLKLSKKENRTEFASHSDCCRKQCSYRGLSANRATLLLQLKALTALSIL